MYEWEHGPRPPRDKLGEYAKALMVVSGTGIVLTGGAMVVTGHGFFDPWIIEFGPKAEKPSPQESFSQDTLKIRPPFPWTGETPVVQMGQEATVYDLDLQTFTYPSLQDKWANLAVGSSGTILDGEVRGYHRYPKTTFVVDGETRREVPSLPAEMESRRWNANIKPEDLTGRGSLRVYYITTMGRDNSFFAVGPFRPDTQDIMLSFDKAYTSSGPRYTLPISRPDLTPTAWVGFTPLPDSKWLAFDTESPLQDIQSIAVTVASPRGPVDKVFITQESVRGLTQAQNIPLGLYEIR